MSMSILYSLWVVPNEGDLIKQRIRFSHILFRISIIAMLLLNYEKPILMTNLKFDI